MRREGPCLDLGREVFLAMLVHDSQEPSRVADVERVQRESDERAIKDGCRLSHHQTVSCIQRRYRNSPNIA